MTAHRRPSDLGSAGRALWKAVTGAWELSAHETLVLADAARQADRAEEARNIIAAQGVLVDSGRAGLKAHPAVAVERNASAAVVGLLRSIGVQHAASGQQREAGGRFGVLRAI